MGPGALRQSLAWPLRASLGCVSRLLDLCLELAWVIADASGECRYLCPPRPPKSRALVSCVGSLSGSSRLRRSLRGSGYHVTHGQLVSEEGHMCPSETLAPSDAATRHRPLHSSSVARPSDPTKPPPLSASVLHLLKMFEYNMKHCNVMDIKATQQIVEAC